jgi:hypothetical protein
MASSTPVVQNKAIPATHSSGSAITAWTVPKYHTDITLLLLSSGSDDDFPNNHKSEIRSRLTTTVLGNTPQNIQIDITVQDGQVFPNGGIPLAQFSKTTSYIPVIFSVLVIERDTFPNSDEIILKREFDFETTTPDWANGEPFEIFGVNGGYKAVLKFQVSRIA